MIAKQTFSSFFKTGSDGWIIPLDPARGPWAEDACHAGPVTGMIARSLEHHVGDKQLFRLTIELVKPVPMSGFRIESTHTKQGRMISTAQARVLDREGTLIAQAYSLHATLRQFNPLPTAQVEHPDFTQAQTGEFPIRETRHGLPFFSSGIEVRYPPGEHAGPGPTTVWMRTLPLLEDECMSPFQSLCPLADCGNGISRNQEVTDAHFVNPDLTIVLYRPPQSEWLASRAKSFWEPNGLGMSEATLFDTEGPIGAALQTLLVTPDSQFK